MTRQEPGLLPLTPVYRLERPAGWWPLMLDAYGRTMTSEATDLNLRIRRILDQERADIARALPEVVHRLSAPEAASPAAKDQRWTESAKHQDSVRGTFVYASDTVGALVRACDQYRTAITTLLGGPARMILPIMGCARAINEAVIRVCWLTDPSITPEERLIRSAADFLGKLQGGIPVLESVEFQVSDGAKKLEKSVEGRDGAINHFRSIGLEVKVHARSGQAQNVRAGTMVANVDLKSSDLNLKYIPKLRYAWLLSSGAAHSDSWLMEGLDGPWDQSLSNAIFPILDFSDALVNALFGYVALPADDMHRRTHTRRIALAAHGSAHGPFIDSASYHRQ